MSAPSGARSRGRRSPPAGAPAVTPAGPHKLNTAVAQAYYNKQDVSKRLSTETGARTYVIRQVGDGVALRNACAQISLELREQYTIGFLAPDPGAGGYRSVRVDVPGRPTSMVRVRKGVEVGGPRAYASDPGAAP